MNVPAPTEVECYWVLPGRFLAGEYPAHMGLPLAERRLDALLAAGMDTFFDLTRSGELQPYYALLEQRAMLRGTRVRHARFPIVDRSLPSREQLLNLLHSIDGALANQQRIYVHCWGGVGRTGLTVACWLIHHGEDSKEALQQIAAWRRPLPSLKECPESPETPEQLAFVRSWHEVYEA